MLFVTAGATAAAVTVLIFKEVSASLYVLVPAAAIVGVVVAAAWIRSDRVPNGTGPV